MDAADLDDLPRHRWGRFPWTDSGMESAEVAIGPTWPGAGKVVPSLWRHFQAANRSFGLPISLVEIGSFKRYGPGASCPRHVDDPQPLSTGRLLSMTVIVEASADLEGGVLHVEGDVIEMWVGQVPGQLAVFASSAQHAVTPVRSGTRTVLVARALSDVGFVASTWLWNPDGTPARRCGAPSSREFRAYRRHLRAARSTTALE